MRIGSLLALTVALSLQMVAGEKNESRLGVKHFPQAVYKGERATFVVSGRTGIKISVEFRGERVAEQILTDAALEFNLEFDGGGVLSFKQGTDEVRFQLVRPEEKISLKDRDGYLFSDEVPAIVLADHRHPPKHDRRWETVSFFRRIFGDPRPEAASGTILYSDALCGGDPRDGKERERQGFWKHVSVQNGFSEINAFVSSTNKIHGRDLFVLVLSDADMERGVDDLELRVKLEWFLQRVSGWGYKYIFVVRPDLNARQRNQFSPLLAGLKTAVGGNKAQCIVFPPRKEVKRTLKEWLEAIQRDVEKRVICR